MVTSINHGEALPISNEIKGLTRLKDVLANEIKAKQSKMSEIESRIKSLEVRLKKVS